MAFYFPGSSAEFPVADGNLCSPVTFTWDTEAGIYQADVWAGWEIEALSI